MIKNKFLYFNILLSIVIFGIILYFNLGKSGGDMAIVLLNFLFGIAQIIFVLIYGYIRKSINKRALLVIILCQTIEFFIFINFGNDINRYYKINHINYEVVE
ncbi:hypothetical protein ASG38_01295 [Flavobacterium sp. Leaf359]|nr:hypothetical protein ASG38_01295 [Flavobacterium sp. Leaf359]PZQ79498.1 MAG: hypothetical protein DI548_14835 [Flavobacterium johnsoniae]